MLLARKCTLRRTSPNGQNGGWHQDGAFMGAGIRSLNVWIPLTHCGDTAPGLDIVGRRLDEIVQTGQGAIYAWATDPDAAERAAAGSIVRPIFEPGDALVFDHMNLHRTAIDPDMQHERYAIETWLMAPSTYDSMTGDADAQCATARPDPYRLMSPRPESQDELGDLAHRVDVLDRDVERRDRAVFPHLEAVADALGRADERDLVGERARHDRDRFVALAFEEQALDLVVLPPRSPSAP